MGELGEGERGVRTEEEEGTKSVRAEEDERLVVVILTLNKPALSVTHKEM